MRTCLSTRFAALARAAVALAAVALVTGCGTTTTMQSREAPGERPDLTEYTHIVVGPFRDEATAAAKFRDEQQQQKYELAVADAGARFRAMLIRELTSSKAFDLVEEGDAPEPDALYLDGDITRFATGNKALRVLVGFGSGKVAFDAVARVRDGQTQQVLGTVVVDKNSFPTGGILALPQTTEGFMKSGARRIAGEMALARGIAETAQESAP